MVERSDRDEAQIRTRLEALLEELRGQAMALETERRRKMETARIRAALKRLKTGEYGYL